MCFLCCTSCQSEFQNSPQLLRCEMSASVVEEHSHSATTTSATMVHSGTLDGMFNNCNYQSLSVQINNCLPPTSS